MREPIHIAAIDAGSNAIRLVIARADSPARTRVLETERAAVRLGREVFNTGRLDRKMIDRATKAFRHFGAVMKHYRVTQYRAVATSATRIARNRSTLINRIRREAGIRLEVIDGAEEARLIRSAVLAALGEETSPRLIVDLGGGSLEINVMRGERVVRSVTLPLGTVRLMENLGLAGPIDEEGEDLLRRRVLAKLGKPLGRLGAERNPFVVACGGNAEALARLAPAPRPDGIPALSLRVLRNRLPGILESSVRGRMRLYGVRRDRAEVMGIAAVILSTLAEKLRLDAFVVPGVGVREGVILDLVRAHYAVRPFRGDDRRARSLVARTRAFAARHEYDHAHCEHVRGLAVSLFDQLRPLHGMSRESRTILQLAALLHDIGHSINASNHHRHGEYLIRHGRLGGVSGWRRDMLACLVRYHCKTEPVPNHKLYASLGTERQQEVRALAAILRLAAGLDADLKQSVSDVRVQFGRGEVVFCAVGTTRGALPLREASRRSELFAQEFGVQARFRDLRGRR